MTMFLLPALLLLIPACDASAPPPTFTDTDPNTGATLQCQRCPPGTHLRARCTSTRQSQCSPCPAGSFTELWNYIPKCLRCGVCGHNQVVKSACSADSDCQCECKEGFYHKKTLDMCVPHTKCPAGHGVLTKGTADEDTVCQACSNDTFSEIKSADQTCTEHRNCSAAGQRLLLKGSPWHDSLCTGCEESQSKDGADYLKELLPAFFTHQNMQDRRLRRIVHRLPSAGGARLRRRSGSRSADPDPQQHIITWMASATASEIRQLPDILTKVGASNAGDRLKHKLQRIDSHLARPCAASSEVEAGSTVG